MTSRNPLIQLGTVVAIAIVALLAGNAVGTNNMDRLLYPLGGLILVVTVVNPFASLIIFLLLFTRFGSYAEIGPIQIGMAVYTALLFLVAFARFLWREPWDRAATRSVTLMFIFMVYLGLSVVEASVNGIPFSDWGRGAYPLVVLCLAAVFATTLQTRRQWNIAAGVFLFIIVSIGMGGVSDLGGRLGGALLSPDVVSWGTTLIPAALMSLGMAMIVEKRELHWGYLAMLATGLFTAVMSPTRTVWVSAGLTVTLMAGVLFFRHRRPGTALAVVAVALAIGGGTLLAWRYGGPTASWQQQTARAQTLSHTSEDPSVLIRQEQIREAIRVFSASPLIGAGLGYQYQYKIAFTSKYEKPNDFNHSDLANALAKTGLLGALLIYGFLITTVLACVRLQKAARLPEERGMGMAAECTLLVALVIGNSTPMLQDKGSALLLALIIGLVLSRLNILYREAAEEQAQQDEDLSAAPETTPWAAPLADG